MPAAIEFIRKHPWAIPPERSRVDPEPLKAYAATAEREFRWHRAGRTPELCWPWRLAAELGWVIRSPVDVRPEPFTDFEVAADPAPGPELAETLRDYDLWTHHRTPLAVSRAGSRWMKLYDFQSEHGWQSMFVPNGKGTVEWQLGWACDWPDGAFALVLPWSYDAPLEVIPGVFDSGYFAAAKSKLGVSIAVRPGRACEIRRGDPVARLVLLHGDSLRTR